MKKVKFLFGALVAIFAVAFTACHPVDTLVDITVKPADTTLAPGEKATFSVTLTPDVTNKGELGACKVLGPDSTELYSNTFSGSNSETFTFDYTVPNDAVDGSSITLTVVATDGKSGKDATSQITINVELGLPEVVAVTGKTVNYNSTNANTELGWDLTADGTDVTIANDDNADLVFFFNDTYRQQILSPDAQQVENQAAYSSWDYSTTGKNTTKFKKMTADDFDNATAESLDAISIDESVTHPGGGNGIDHVQEGDVYAFVLADGRKGLFKVSASNPPYAKSPAISSSITLDFKFQKGTAGDAK